MFHIQAVLALAARTSSGPSQGFGKVAGCPPCVVIM